MSILNLDSDGLPSVLMALVRALRFFGPQSRDDLLALCCPPSLEDNSSSFRGQKHGKSTLKTWTELGLFQEDADGRLHLQEEIATMPTERFREMRAMGTLLRTITFAPQNNQGIATEERPLSSDVSLALSWALAQDVYSLPGGTYGAIGGLENQQFGTSGPYAFQNDTRWNGFKFWAPLLGFGWIERDGGASVLVVDPTDAVRDALAQVFADMNELPIDNWVSRVGEALPVLDGGTYRTKVEARLDERAWRPTSDTEISVSLAAALLGLEADGTLKLERRSDAPHRSLLGRAHREVKQASHVVWQGGARA